MRRFFSTIFSLSVLAAALVLPTPSAATSLMVGSVKILRVGTDAMGSDTFDNRNREFVRLQVTGAPGDVYDVANVKIEDNWAHFSGSPSSCNTYTISTLPDSSDADALPDSTVLPVGTVVTVFNGSHSSGDHWTASEGYKLFANSDTNCGTYGHFLNNDADRVWVTKGPAVKDDESWDWGGGYSISY